MYDSRDYADLKRTDIATYNFRGYTVWLFNKENKQLSIGKHADMCCFIDNDLKAMSRFLDQCHSYSIGLTEVLDHVEVD